MPLISQVCACIRERPLLIGIDPMLAVRLYFGDEAAAELAAYEAAAALPTNELVSCGDVDHDTETLDILDKKIGRMEARFRNGERPNFASDSLVRLLASCFAFDDGPYCEPTS